MSVHGQAADVARQHFQDAANVTVVDDVPIDDGWTRDWGPSVNFKLTEVLFLYRFANRP